MPETDALLPGDQPPANTSGKAMAAVSGYLALSKTLGVIVQDVPLPLGN
jgi:hypothetical protein